MLPEVGAPCFVMVTLPETKENPLPITDRVMIAVDPHKASWTAAAVNAALQPLATLRVPVSAQGYQQLRRFARRWPDATWAIEGAGGLGVPLLTRLCADGLLVVDVPTVQVDEAVAALRALVEHREDLVRARTQTVNRLHALLTQLIPAGVPTGLTADTAAALLRRVRPKTPLQQTLRRLATDLITEVRRLDRRITAAGRTSQPPSPPPGAPWPSSTASAPCWPARSSPESA